MAWADGLLLLQAPADTVMVDTGPLTRGTYVVQVVLHGNIGYEAVFQCRDAANQTTLASHVLSCVLSSVSLLCELDLDHHQRLRVVSKTDLSAQAGAESEAALFFRQSTTPYPVDYAV